MLRTAQQVPHDPVVATPSTGTLTTSSRTSPAFWWHRHHDAAELMIGAVINMVHVMPPAAGSAGRRCGAGEQRRRTEPGGLLGREARHVVKDRDRRSRRTPCLPRPVEDGPTAHSTCIAVTPSMMPPSW